MTLQADIDSLARLIGEARRAVVFTGAGISTESGIPDFRSPGGIWTQMAPIYFDDFLASEEARRETWRRRFAMQDTFGARQPNRGHRAVDALVRRGKASAVITQNIDGLHQASGIPADKVIELHGNTTYATCLDCGTRHELADIRVGSSATARRRAAALPRASSRPRRSRSARRCRSRRCAAPRPRRWPPTVHRARLVAGGVSGGRVPRTGEAQRRDAGDRQPRADALDAIADLVIHRGIGDTLGGAVGVN